jgi:hypothetical protein
MESDYGTVKRRIRIEIVQFSNRSLILLYFFLCVGNFCFLDPDLDPQPSYPARIQSGSGLYYGILLWHFDLLLMIRNQLGQGIPIGIWNQELG